MLVSDWRDAIGTKMVRAFTRRVLLKENWAGVFLFFFFLMSYGSGSWNDAMWPAG